MEDQADLIEFRVAGLTKRRSGLIKRLLNKNKEFVLSLEQVDDPAEQLIMIIGKTEAIDLTIAIEEMKSLRPLPGELLKTIIIEFGFTLSKVIVDDLIDGTFYSKMILTKNNEIKIIDCRPADAITLATRFNCKLYIAKTVVEKAKG